MRGGQRVIWRSDHHEGVVHEGLGGNVKIFWRLTHDCKIGQIIRQLLQYRFAIRNVKAYGNAAVSLAEFCQQMGGKVVGRTDHRYIKLSPLQALQFVERKLHVSQLLGDGPAVVIKFVSGIGEVDFLAHLFKQRQADIILQLLDLHGNSRLSQMELLCGAREAQVAGNRFEYFQLPQRDVQHAFRQDRL
jgi:hypothetical protein